MTVRLRTAILFSALLLSACNPAMLQNMMDEEKTAVDDSAMMNDGEEKMKPEEGQGQQGEQTKTEVYADFNEDVLTNGHAKVLFFHAAWCPKCKAHHERLSQWYPSSELGYSVYKIDYDSSLALRSRYGVIQQHTFVLVDGDGNKISSVNYPDDIGLEAFLKG